MFDLTRFGCRLFTIFFSLAAALFFGMWQESISAGLALWYSLATLYCIIHGAR